MELNDKNYYTPEADKAYQSASQFKEFHDKCPAEAIAKINGWQEGDKRALGIGLYMDALWDGEEALNELMLEARDKYFTKQGKKRADVIAADKAYMRAQTEPKMVEYMQGEHQRIFTGEIAGVPFKCKLDNFVEHDKIVDMKYMKDMQPSWDSQKHEYVTFIDKYSYARQLAIYQYLVSQAYGGELLPCYIECITKEDPCDMAIIEIPQWKLNSELEVVKHYAPIYQEMKEGKREAPRCGHCEYCLETKEITGPITYEELLKEI